MLIAPAPDISVVLLCSPRAASSVAASLASLLRAADGLAWQLVAVSDQPEPLLEAFAALQPSGRVQLLLHPTEPMAQARNAALPHCRAPLLAFLQADQRCLPGRLQRPLHFFAQYPDLALIWGGWQVGSQCHQPWQRPLSFAAHSRLQDPCLAAGALTVRREALEAVGGWDAALPAWSGVDLALRLHAGGAVIGWLPETLVRWRPLQLASPWPVRQLQRGLELLIANHSEGLRPALLQELRFAALAWCAALAWQQQELPLAEDLLRLAHNSAPLPQPRALLQLLEQACRCQRWCGGSGDARQLRQQGFWQQCEAIWGGPMPVAAR